MTPLEMIAEWRKGCSCGGPMFDLTEGRARGTTSPAQCEECTVALIDAIERVERERLGEEAVSIDERILRDRIRQTRIRIRAVGPMHASYDVIADAEALLEGRPTLIDHGPRSDAIRKLIAELA